MWHGGRDLDNFEKDSVEEQLTHIKNKSFKYFVIPEGLEPSTYCEQLLYPVELRNQIMMANVNLLIYSCKR